MSITDKVVTGASGVGLFSWLTNKLYGRMTDSAYNKYAHVYEPADIVSIVIPAFNEEEYIEKTLKSILSQNIILDYPDYFECIVVDNESTDRTAEIAKQYCQVTSAPRGKLNALTAGIKYASGNIIVTRDADTYYPPNCLNILLRHFHNPNVVAVTGPHLTQGNLVFRLMSVWGWNIIPFAKNKLSGSNSAFRKDAFLKVGGYDLSIDQFDVEKMIMEEEIVLRGKLLNIGEVIFDLQACCFQLRPSLGRKVIIEQRLAKGKYYEEITGGERF